MSPIRHTKNLLGEYTITSRVAHYRQKVNID